MLRWWLNDSVESESLGIEGSGSELTETTVGVTANSDACVVFLNTWGGEGSDRVELTNGTQDAYVSRDGYELQRILTETDSSTL